MLSLVAFLSVVTLVFSVTLAFSVTLTLLSVTFILSLMTFPLLLPVAVAMLVTVDEKFINNNVETKMAVKKLR